MRRKMYERIISILLAFAMVVGMMPATAYARTVLPQAGVGAINLQMTIDGVLTWDSVQEASGYYFTISDGASTWYLDENYTATSFNFIENFDSRKIDSGAYEINLRANGSGVYDITGELIYYYVSPYDKLEAPTNLRWEGTIAKWDAVPNATGYTVYLYQPSGTQYSSYKVDGNSNTSKDFSDVYGLNSGWWFKVEATSMATAPETIYRDSNSNESPKECQSRENAAQTVTGNINLQMSSDGVLMWDSIQGATDYYFTIGNVGSTYFFDSNYDGTSFNFLENFDSRKMDTGVYELRVKANGSGDVYDKSGVLIYYYVSPYNKLEAPTNLRWEGTTAKWDAVPNATGYTVYLHQAGGTQYSSYKIDGNANTSKDFSDVSGLSGGWWFEIEATSTAVAPESVYRDSDKNESPKAQKMSSITYAINCLAYDINNMEFAGGTVSVETDMDTSDGTVVCGTASEKTIVRIEAVAKEGYKFVEWRKSSPDSPSAVISKNAEHAFIAMEEMWLYAVFQEEGTETIFPAGAGYSASNPAKCSTYEEFKYAMEHEGIRYVALGNVDEIITPIDGEELIVAINVNGTKNLMLLGEATFTAPASGKTYAALLHTVSNNNLNISGSGSLKFRAIANNSYNAVIYNQGGNISVDSGTLIGSFNTAVYGKAIWQSSGELRIKGGNLLAENALAPGPHPGYKSAVTLEGGNTWIQGGTFKTENVISTIDLPYGLDIGQNATVDLQGGTFHGICLPTDTTPLADYMDESIYTPLSDESWFDPNSQYSQEYAESGKIVRIAWLIDHADVHINSPVAGVDINDNYFNVVTSGVRSVLYYPQWYKDGELITYGTFEAGANYKVVIRLESKYEYNAEFKSGVTVAVNNQAADVVVPNGMSGKEIIEVTYDFGECPSVIDSVELTVTAPKEGNKPSYTVGCGSSAYYAVGGSSNYTDYRQWYVSDTGEDNSWSQMQPTDRFVAGKYYKFYVDIRTMNGYEFPVYDNGSSIVPDVLAMVNGYTANVIKAYDQDPGCYITVEYNFGECNDSVVENIIVMDVKQPVAGELPTYTYNILGSGYKMNTAKNAYYDAYWLNPAEKWYYIKNGIGWYDLTKNDWVYEHEAFIPGHEYQVNVYLVTEEGYEFAHDKYYTPEVTAMVNGQSADVHITGSDCTRSQQVKYTFTCEKQEIYTVFIGDLDTPKAGNTPDYDITTGIPEYYILDAAYGIGGMYWYDEQGGILTEDDEFEEGKKYQLEIKIVPAKVDGVTTSVFVTGLNAMADNLQASDVYAMSDRAYLYFDYVCEAKQSVSVMGTITSFGSDTDDIIVQLIPKGLTEVAYETRVSGTLIGYIIMDVPAGDYILKITKSGHAVKECAVTVGRSDVVQDATLWLYGDGDHNGVVNVQDAVLMKKYLAGMNVEMDLTVANVNADTTVDTKDAVMLMKKLAGMDVELGKA